MRIIKHLVLSLLFAFPALSKYPIEIFTTDKESHKLTLYLEFGYPFVLIDSKKFPCGNFDSCRYTDETPKEGTYNSQTYTYRDARVKIKLLKVGKEEDFIEFEIPARLNNKFSMIGMNDINGFTNFMPDEYELVIDLKENTMRVQEFVKQRCKR